MLADVGSENFQKLPKQYSVIMDLLLRRAIFRAALEISVNTVLASLGDYTRSLPKFEGFNAKFDLNNAWQGWILTYLHHKSLKSRP